MSILNVIDLGGVQDMKHPLCSRQRRPCCSVGSAVRARQLRSAYEETLPPTGSSRRCAAPQPSLLLTEHNALIIHALFQVWIIQKSGSRRAQTVGDHSTHSRMFSLPENPAAHLPSVAAAPSLCLLPTEVHRPRQLSEKVFSPHDSHIDVLPD